MGRRLASTVAAALMLAACTDGGDTAPEPTVATTTTTTIPARLNDGVLRLGLLLPTNDVLIGVGLVEAALTAVERVNEAGGVLGADVETVIADEGNSESTAAAAIDQLLDANVDAVIGPTSSLVALSTLDELVSSGVVVCSPTASALLLDDFPDDELFFRTVPSDSLQAVAIADEAAGTGAQNIAVVHIDDAYGRPFAEAVTDALSERSRSTTVVQTFGFARADGDLDQLARSVVDSGARAIVVIADSQDGTAFLDALGRADYGAVVKIIVNDALRNPESQQRVETLPTDLRNLIRGVAPQAASNSDNPFDPPGLFAVNAYDCVTLIALASRRVGSDNPSDIADQIPSLTTGGLVCTSYEACAQRLSDGLEVNYNGPDGLTELLQTGHPARARFDTFVFDENGRAVYDGSILASAL